MWWVTEEDVEEDIEEAEAMEKGDKAVSQQDLEDRVYASNAGTLYLPPWDHLITNTPTSDAELPS